MALGKAKTPRAPHPPFNNTATTFTAAKRQRRISPQVTLQKDVATGGAPTTTNDQQQQGQSPPPSPRRPTTQQQVNNAHQVENADRINIPTLGNTEDSKAHQSPPPPPLDPQVVEFWKMIDAQELIVEEAKE